MSRDFKICEICGKKVKNLGAHITKSHKNIITSKEYYDKYLKKLGEDICPVCGNHNTYVDISFGYRSHCSVKCSNNDPNVQKKLKNTNIKKYGTVCPANANNQEKAKQTKLLKYGDKNYNNLEKMIQTKKDRNNLTSSSLELLLSNELDRLNVEYKTQFICNKYPYFCDFYLPKSDTFIEINAHWTHGFHWFDETNPEDIKTLNIWKEKAKSSEFYKSAIDIWTKKDLEKKMIAEQNNLNYIVLWNRNDIDTYVKMEY